MASASTFPQTPLLRTRFAGAATARPLYAALLVTAIATLFRLSGTVDSDVAWQLWIAGRIHAGAHLYRDIIEVNPPLWFWMALPIDSAASFFHARIEAILAIAIGCFAALSLAATDQLLGELTPPRRTLFLGYAALVLLGLPWVHIGQREQIVLIASLPYAALIATRREGMQANWLLAALIGTVAAVGFALKHYFLIVPVSLELWLLIGRKSDWRWRRPETLAIVAVGTLYAAAIVVWTRDFLTDIVPLVRLSYGMLGAPSLRYLFGPLAIAGIATLVLTLFSKLAFARGRAPLAEALLVASGAFGAVYFIQSKGWTYHAIPLFGCAALALAALLAESRAPMRLLRLAAPAILSLPLFITAGEARDAVLPNPEIESAVSGLHPGDSVGFLAIETALPWSVTLQHEFRYPSRYMGYWMLVAVVANERRATPDPRLVVLGRRIISETVADFRCAPPRRIIVARPRPHQPGFDILAFFLRDPEFAALLSHYRVKSRTNLETLELATPLPKPAPASCRAGV